jgi:queuine tRNA-ribosyltransferase
MLSDNAARRYMFGAGNVMELPDGRPAAAKTGTSNDWRDSWAMGYTPEITIGVWVGNNDGSPMAEVAGANGAGLIWRDLMLAYHQGRDPDALPNPRQRLFGIVHGGVFPNLRRASAEFIGGMPFDGLCIGGSLGGDKAQMYEVVDMTVPHMPDGMARHLLGVGDVDDLLECVARGIDMFDCVSPTRLGRHGAALVRDPARRWKLNVHNAALREDDGPLQEGCPCPTCRTFSRAYIHYLFRAQELLGIRLLSLHNVTFLLSLMAEVRASLAAGAFTEFYQAWLGKPLAVEG